MTSRQTGWGSFLGEKQPLHLRTRRASRWRPSQQDGGRTVWPGLPLFLPQRVGVVEPEVHAGKLAGCGSAAGYSSLLAAGVPTAQDSWATALRALAVCP